MGDFFVQRGGIIDQNPYLANYSPRICVYCSTFAANLGMIPQMKRI